MAEVTSINTWHTATVTISRCTWSDNIREQGQQILSPQACAWGWKQSSRTASLVWRLYNRMTIYSLAAVNGTVKTIILRRRHRPRQQVLCRDKTKAAGSTISTSMVGYTPHAVFLLLYGDQRWLCTLSSTTEGLSVPHLMCWWIKRTFTTTWHCCGTFVILAPDTKLQTYLLSTQQVTHI